MVTAEQRKRWRGELAIFQDAGLHPWELTSLELLDALDAAEAEVARLKDSHQGDTCHEAWMDAVVAKSNAERERDAARAECQRLREHLADATRFCSGEFPCEASTSAASLERERNELRARVQRLEEALRACISRFESVDGLKAEHVIRQARAALAESA